MGESVKATFLDDVLRTEVPNLANPIEALNDLRSQIEERPTLKENIERILSSPLIDFGPRIGIYRLVDGQRVRAYLAEKEVLEESQVVERGITLLYPESGVIGWNPKSRFLAFPYNLDPKLAPATLVTLKEMYGAGYQYRFGESAPQDGSRYIERRKALIEHTLNFFTKSHPRSTGQGEFQEKEIRVAFSPFVEAYNSFKEEVKGADAYKSLILMLVFTAVYTRIRQMLENPVFKYSFSYPREFLGAAPRTVDIGEIFGYLERSPINKYIKAQDFYDLPIERRWKIVNAQLIRELATR